MIGFSAGPPLAAGDVDAATGFWNAEGVALRERGVPIRTFKVDEFGAPPYPELILTTSRQTLEDDPKLVEEVVAATRRGYTFTERDPDTALKALVASNPELAVAEQQAQLKALLPILQPRPFDFDVLGQWADWDLQHGLLEKPLDVEQAFSQGG
jgi:putative hydroxymethylpyrimidine transport system substrate-binding protein